MMFPGWEVACFGVVASVCQDQSNSDSYNFVVEKYDSAIIESCLVEDRAANFGNDSFSNSWLDNVLDDVPGVEDGIVL
jgi:hypothetical protein